MPKPKDRLPPGWRLDPDDPDPANNYAARVYVPYILLPDNAMPLLPFAHIAIAYLVARQINAFLRAL